MKKTWVQFKPEAAFQILAPEIHKALVSRLPSALEQIGIAPALLSAYIPKLIPVLIPALTSDVVRSIYSQHVNLFGSENNNLVQQFHGMTGVNVTSKNGNTAPQTITLAPQVPQMIPMNEPFPGPLLDSLPETPAGTPDTLEIS